MPSELNADMSAFVKPDQRVQVGTGRSGCSGGGRRNQKSMHGAQKKTTSAPPLHPPPSQPVVQHVFASSDVRYKNTLLQGYITIPGKSIFCLFFSSRSKMSLFILLGTSVDSQQQPASRIVGTAVNARQAIGHG